MKYHILIIIILLSFFATNLQAQDTIPLPVDDLEISLLTYSPLPEIYGAFGHSAVRIVDKSKRTDVIYNYGIFDYDEPNFTMKFLRGKLEYQLGKENAGRVFRYYASTGGRQIFEQKLLLHPEEESKVHEYLETNYLPENRKYYYDFFFDNCATRIRDILENALGDKMVYKTDVDTSLTLRQLIDVHVTTRPWDDLGMDLLIGTPTDRKATYREQMFLPSYLSDNLTNGVEVIRGNTAPTALLGEKKKVVDGDYYLGKSPWYTRPITLFGLLAFILLAINIIFKEEKWLRYIDATIFFLYGLAGAIFLFMWFGTHHDATQWNLNILWANPLYLLFFIPIARGNTKWSNIAYSMAIITSIAILLGWFFHFPQQYNIGVLPFVLIALIISTRKLLVQKNRNPAS